MANGGLQIYIATTMSRENMKVIMGKSLSKQKLAKIKTILEDRDTILRVEGLRTESLSSGSVKLYVDVVFNSAELNKNVLAVVKPDIEAISSDPVMQANIRRIVVKSMEILLTHTTEIIKDMEEGVKKDHPNVKIVDIEQSQKNINPKYEGVVTDSEDTEESDKKK